MALRIAGILVSPLELGPDEAQYWRWSTTPAFGYYSKPPLIAWVISLFTGLFGTSEWAVRLPAPLLHGVTALILFRLGERIFDARVGVVAAIYYILMPGVTFSSAVMTTDAVLFPCWAMALLALWTLRERSGHWPSAVMLGLAVGLGFLAKYAMVYFLVGAAAAMMIDRPTRRALLSRQGLLACGLALLIVSPHLFWNLQNQFQTVGHTVDNANWQGAAFAPQNAIRFGVDQMGIFGPIGFLVLCGLMLALVTHWRRGRPVSEPYRWLACFVVPALGVILLQSMIARAHANWAATAYLAGTIWASAMFVSRRDVPVVVWALIAGIMFAAALFVPTLSLTARIGLGAGLAGSVIAGGIASGWRTHGLLWTGLAHNVAAAVVFASLAAGPHSVADRMGLGGAFRQASGWTETSRQLAAAVEAHGASVLLVDEREVWHGLDFYGHEVIPVPRLAWRRTSQPVSFAETVDLRDVGSSRVLVASLKPHLRPRMRADFQTFTHIDDIEILLGGSSVRRLRLYLASGYEPLDRTPDWEARFDGVSEP